MTTNDKLNEEPNTNDDPVGAYKQSLSELIFNSKPHIVMLTMLAEELKDVYPADIVNCIEERLYQVKNEIKLPTLYLIDSICKNIRNSSYSQLFQKRIVNLFCHTFSRSDEKTRELLFKLRQTWKDYFVQDVLHNLDLAVKQIDPGWPLVEKVQSNNKQSNNNNNNTNTSNTNKNSINQQQSTNSKEKATIKSQFGTIKLNETDSGTGTIGKIKAGTTHPTIIILKPNDLEEKRKNVETELRQMINRNSNLLTKQQSTTNKITSKPNIIKLNKIEQSPSINTNTNTSINLNPSPNTNSNPIANPNNKRNKTNQSTKNANSSKKENKYLNDKKIVMPMDIILPKKIKTKIPKRKTVTSSAVETNVHPTKIAKKNQEETVVPIVAPADVIPLGRDYHVAVSKRTKEARIRNENIAAIKNIKNRRPTNDSGRRNSPTLSTGRKCISPTNAPISSNDSKKQQPTMHTTIPAPNVFTQPEVLYPFNNTAENNSKQNASNFCMDRDYRHEFETLMNDAEKKLSAGTLSSADHAIIVREAERHLFALQNRQQPCQTAPNPQNLLSMSNTPQTLPPPPPSQPYPPMNPHPEFNQMLPSNNYGLEPPNGSAPIYINKQFCRVFYLDHITGIVLFKMHPDTPFDHLVTLDPVYLEPKQVYFSGHPTNVIMDPGLPTEQSFCLNFNSPTPYVFSLNGIPQRIMLGLPDRELIVNDRPYKAQFGGQPISVYMESDNLNHMFLLSDSRPFLQVSEEPRYDLWNRLVNEAKAKLNAVSTSTNVGYGFEPSVTNTTMTIPATASTTFINTNHQQPIYRTTTTTVNDPTFQSNESFAPNPVQFTETKPVSDLKSLLSKLTAIGLINNPATTSIENKETEPKKLPEKKYLPLDMAELKKDHQFVIDQLYMGIQCTNCSLRFPDESMQDHLGKKSRYATHLDWHFRQNRREKAKPEFGSTAVAHRRPWYYTFDQWIQFKEVNDDVEDENHSFFDLNLPNSPNDSNKTTMFNMNFSVYKNSISDFDLFIETISCDNNKTNMDDEKICSVLADSDVTSNCTVCNEPFDIRWFEEEEEWRLMNAVCYKNDDDESGQNFHPLCLKDHLLQSLFFCE